MKADEAFKQKGLQKISKAKKGNFFSQLVFQWSMLLLIGGYRLWAVVSYSQN